MQALLALAQGSSARVRSVTSRMIESIARRRPSRTRNSARDWTNRSVPSFRRIHASWTGAMVGLAKTARYCSSAQARCSGGKITA